MERTFTLTEELDLLNNIPTNSNPLIALELANIEIVNPDALSDAYWSPVEKSLALQQ